MESKIECLKILKIFELSNKRIETGASYQTIFFIVELFTCVNHS